MQEDMETMQDRSNRLIEELRVPDTYESHATTDTEVVQRGLNFIFRLAVDKENFKTFGTDILQTFYDVATTAEEPLRRYALLRAEVTAQMWLKTYPTLMKSNENGAVEEVSADEILDFIMGIYALERVGIGHDSKEEVRKEAKAFTTEDFFGEDESAFEYKPTLSEPTMNLTSFTTALTNSYYANKIGISIRINLSSLLKLLPLYRPYKIYNNKNFDFDEFAVQLTMIFNLIHVLSNNGEFRLSPGLLYQETEFLDNRFNIDKAIEYKDVHLVGEIVHCLRVLGMSENNYSITKGLQFLRATQKLDGSWPTRDNASDNYTRYHAVMCAVSALNVQRFRGFGPSEPKLYELLKKIQHSTATSHDLTKGVAKRTASGQYGSSSYINSEIHALKDFNMLNDYYSATASVVESEYNPSPQIYGQIRLQELLTSKKETTRSYHHLKSESKTKSRKMKKRKLNEEE